MLTKSDKEEIVSGLADATSSSKGVVFVNFHGLNVTDEFALRRQLREQGVSYKVARKTLLKRAFQDKAEGEMPELTGEVAVAYSEDPTSPAREIHNFAKGKEGVLKILGGIFEGKFQPGAFMQEIATIPSKEVLLSKLAFLFKSPMQRLAIGISEVAKKKA